LEPVVFAQAARPLLVVHALVAMALLGVTTHLVVVKGLRWRGRPREKLEQTYSRLIAPLYGATFFFGLLLYPNFRVAVRGGYLDANQPWASNLFDFKEHLAALGIPLAVGLYYLAKKGAAVRPLTDLFAILLWAMVVWEVVSGLIITSVKGV
jgi:hypothetical protein